MSPWDDIKIVYEDDEIVAVNKPAGLVTHSDGRTEERTLADWFVAYFPAARGVGEPLVLSSGRIIERHGVVHRIDRETSGIILLAKTQQSFDFLKEQFQARSVKKLYYAFIYGVPRERSGIIDRPIGRSRRDFRLFSAERGAAGVLRDAVTEYVVRESNDAFSFVEVRPRTGRTHQIRAHMKALQHPVVCDRLYAPRRACALGFTRLALHAGAITFTREETSRLTLEAPLPDDFLHALEELRSGRLE